MGNQQSNERQKNWKIYKIIGKGGGDGYIRCYLDDYVPFSNGDYKRIDFEKVPTFLTVGALLLGESSGASLCEGSHIAIDVNMTRNYNNGCNFDSRHDVKEVVFRGSLPGEGGLQGLVGDIAQAREMRANANEWSNFDKQMQQAWQLQPPKK